MPFERLSDHIPLTLTAQGEPVEFEFQVGRALGHGILFYMLDGEGGLGYTIDLNGRQGPLFSTPPVRLYCSFCTTLGPPLEPLRDFSDTSNMPRGLNRLQFTPVGAGPPLNILHVVVQYVAPGFG
jgi:hypothetical protein